MIVSKKFSELVFGIVGPLGIDLDKIVSTLQTELEKVQYISEEIRLSSLLSEIEGLDKPLDNSDEYKRIESKMDSGDALRKKISGDALAILELGKIQKIRSEKTDSPFTSHAFILRSLKHTNEEQKLRKVYGQNSWLISIYSPRENRTESLARKLGSQHGKEN